MPQVAVMNYVNIFFPHKVANILTISIPSIEHNAHVVRTGP